jgi:hypothetical protein
MGLLETDDWKAWKELTMYSESNSPFNLLSLWQLSNLKVGLIKAQSIPFLLPNYDVYRDHMEICCSKMGIHFCKIDQFLVNDY